MHNYFITEGSNTRTTSAVETDSLGNMYKSATTLDDIYHLALPVATELLAGAEVLNRTVSWACSLRPSPPAFPKLEGNELALIDMDDLRRLDARRSLDRV